MDLANVNEWKIFFDPYILPSNSFQNIRQNHDNEILVNESHIFYEASLNVMCAWIQYAKLSWMFAHKKPYDIGQYHWTMKCRSRNLHLHILRLFLCHTESKALRTTFIHHTFEVFRLSKGSNGNQWIPMTPMVNLQLASVTKFRTHPRNINEYIRTSFISSLGNH